MSSRDAAIARAWRQVTLERLVFLLLLRKNMADTASHVSFLPPILTFCGAAVVAVPLFRLLGLSAVLGYLAAGVVIGPSGLPLIEDPETTPRWPSSASCSCCSSSGWN